MFKSKKKLISDKISILITRPIKDSEELLKNLDPDKFNFYKAPLLEINKIAYKFDEKSNYDLVIFTSKNGLKNFNYRCLKQGAEVFVIGDGTNLLAKKHGIVNLSNVNGDIKILMKKIKPSLEDGMVIIHPTSMKLNQELRRFFEKQNCRYKPISCYNSKMVNSHPEVFENFFKSCKDGLITLFSSRTAKSFRNEILKFDLKRNCREKKVLVLSNSIKKEIENLGFKEILITKQPNEKSMISLLKEIERTEYLID